MNKLIKYLSVLIATILLLGTTISCANKEVTLKVFAAQSLQNALNELNELYMQNNSNVKIESNFNGSGALQAQIENAPAGSCDVFISAAAQQMDNLQSKNLLLDSSRKNLLNNNIVLIVPKNSTWNISSFNDLANATSKTLALGTWDSVPAGTYAKEAFELLDIWDSVQAATKIVQFSDVKQVAQAVASGNADAGVVYSTDALADNGVRVVAQGPAAINAKIVYPAAVLKESRNQTEAQKYIDFLFSDEAKAIFERFGFVIATM